MLQQSSDDDDDDSDNISHSENEDEHEHESIFEIYKNLIKHNQKEAENQMIKYLLTRKTLSLSQQEEISLTQKQEIQIGIQVIDNIGFNTIANIISKYINDKEKEKEEVQINLDEISNSDQIQMYNSIIKRIKIQYNKIEQNLNEQEQINKFLMSEDESEMEDARMSEDESDDHYAQTEHYDIDWLKDYPHRCKICGYISFKTEQELQEHSEDFH